MQHTSIKLSPRHKFALQVMAAVEGTSQSVAFERVVERIADELPISRHWAVMWDEEEAVRLLNLYSLPEFKPTPRERTRLAFLVAHAQFFWADKARQTPHRPRAMTLWTHLDDLEDLWTKKKSEDYHAAAKAMASLLRKAKLDPPPYG